METSQASTTQHEIIGLLPDLIDLLKNNRLEIKQGISAAIAAYSNDENARRALFGPPTSNQPQSQNQPRDPRVRMLIKNLVNLLDDSDVMTARAVMSALTNFALEEEACRMMADMGVVETVLAALLDKDNQGTRSLDMVRCGLMANISRDENAVYKILKELVPNRKGDEGSTPAGGSKYAKILLEDRILQVFTRMVDNDNYQTNFDPYESYTMFMANLAAIGPGRKMAMENEMHIAKMTIKMMRTTQNKNRKLGAALLIRNLAMDEQYHESLISLTGEHDMVASCAMPLICMDADLKKPISQEEIRNIHSEFLDDAFNNMKIEQSSSSSEQCEDRQFSVYECIPEIRKSLVESFLGLCKSKVGRDALRIRNVYPILRTAHEKETVDDIAELIQRIVDRTVLADEDPELNEEDDSSNPSDNIPQSSRIEVLD